MSNRTHFMTSAALALFLCACSENSAHETDNPNSLEQIKQGAAKAKDGLAESWAAAVHEMDSMATEIKAKVQAATPEMKARLHELQATFDEQLALAKQKLAEAKAAAPQEVERLKREARENFEAAKRAWSEAVSH